MSEHTPAPWFVSIGKEHGDFGTIVGYCVEGVKSADGRWVVRFDDDYGTDQGSDAQLIALAPDLLRELRLFVSAMEDGHDAMLVTAEKRARRVIAKADG